MILHSVTRRQSLTKCITGLDTETAGAQRIQPGRWYDMNAVVCTRHGLIASNFADTVMAEYITIMLVNDKSPGKARFSLHATSKPSELKAVTEQVTLELTECKLRIFIVYRTVQFKT